MEGEEALSGEADCKKERGGRGACVLVSPPSHE